MAELRDLVEHGYADGHDDGDVNGDGNVNEYVRYPFLLDRLRLSTA